MPKTITPNRRRGALADRIDMAEAVEFTGYSRKTLTYAAGRGEIPEAWQLKPNSPWYFTVKGLEQWLGLRSDDTAGAA